MENSPRHYILVDFENVPTIRPELVLGLPVRLVLFTGVTQKTLTVEFVKSLLVLGQNVEIRKSAGGGKNVLDFQLCFYAGQVCQSAPGAGIHIISKDKGFDSLIHHLKAGGRCCSRADSLDALDFVRARVPKNAVKKEDFATMNMHERVHCAIRWLAKIPGNARPGKPLTLASAIHSLFNKQLSATDVRDVVVELKKQKIIRVGANNALSYHIEVAALMADATSPCPVAC